MNTLELIKDSCLFGGTVPKERTEEVKTFLDSIEKQLTIPVVVNSKRINLVVFEEYTRCYKVSDEELEQLKKDNDIEEGDMVCKVEVIKEY